MTLNAELQNTSAKQTIDRVLARCKKSGDCMIWQGKYHRWTCEVKYQGRAVSAQRLIIQMSHGHNPTKINKTCGNLKCCNIDHLHYEVDGKAVLTTMRDCPRCGVPYVYEPQKEYCHQCAKYGIHSGRTSTVRTRKKLAVNRIDFNKLSREKKRRMISTKAYLDSSQFYADYTAQKRPGENIRDFRDRKRDELMAEPIKQETPTYEQKQQIAYENRKFFGGNKSQRLFAKRRSKFIGNEEAAK